MKKKAEKNIESVKINTESAEREKIRFDFVIPDHKNLTPINLFMLELMRVHPEWFWDDFKIIAAYGCPGKVIWNGNRPNTFDYSFSESLKVFDAYKEKGLSYRFTFTNNLLEEKHCSDTYANAILTAAKERNLSAIIVNSDVLEAYLKKEYPDIPLVHSISKFLKDGSGDLDIINELSKTELTLLPLKYTNDWDFISKLKHPENIEVLWNQPCHVTNCPFCAEHYKSFNAYNLYQATDYKICYFVKDPSLYSKIPEDRHLVNRDMAKLYEIYGITHMKLEGRDSSIDKAIAAYTSHFVKPDYVKSFIRYILFLMERPERNKLFDNWPVNPHDIDLLYDKYHIDDDSFKLF